ncbi:MAG: hypothetical protein MI975_17450 [Cytophagales bacterium]|nr:hypothetical protein [Cytophagales bacterium]
MDKKRFPWQRSSVPSDRFYDDFDLRFDYLKQDSINQNYYYYSLRADSPQRLQPEIYTGRIKPFENSDKYTELKIYLRKVVDSVSYDKKISSSDEVRSYLFPATLTFTSYHTNYLRPAVTFSGFNFLYINALLAVLYVLYTRIRKQKLSFVALAGTGLAGIYGFIPALVINLSQ